MSEVVFNHESESLIEACGLKDFPKLRERFNSSGKALTDYYVGRTNDIRDFEELDTIEKAFMLVDVTMFPTEFPHILMIPHANEERIDNELATWLFEENPYPPSRVVECIYDHLKKGKDPIDLLHTLIYTRQKSFYDNVNVDDEEGFIDA